MRVRSSQENRHRAMTFGAALLFAAGLATSACTVNSDGVVPVIENGSIADFSTYVQPLLQVGCASLDCHGMDGRPLRLYARNGLRRDVALRGEDASDEEMLLNMSAIAGLQPVVDQVEDNLFLLKPLAVDAGGIHHTGGDLWVDQSAGVYRCFHAWLRAGVGDDASRSICSKELP